ncbi:MAG: DDE-type integrase/transposase/recombinase [Turicibacter sp.]|nr:DDE-type integrase/transposase/recombinase [Turicibacter sp.]
MNDNDREKIALFKYGLISPLLHNVIDHQEYLGQLEGQTHTFPHYGEKTVAVKTLKAWALQYRRDGIQALYPKKRSDRGEARKLSGDSLEHILELRRSCPLVPVSVFYRQLVKDGEIREAEISYSSFARLLKKHNLAGKCDTAQTERKRFAHEKVNMLWQGDASHGPYIQIGKKAVKTYLIMYIEDCSRLIPYGEFFTDEKFQGLRQVTKEAILRRGVPKAIYSDNGKIYRSEMLASACAHLGISLIHAKPYTPQGKGKIERAFRTVQTQFYSQLKMNPVYSLEDLNKRFRSWLETEYHRSIHSSLDGQTPIQVYQNQLDSVQFLKDTSDFDLIFLKRERRKVKSDGTISLEKKLYEVPARFVGEMVDVRYDENGVYVFEDNKKAAEATLVNFSDNAHAKRGNSPFDFPTSKEETVDV